MLGAKVLRRGRGAQDNKGKEGIAGLEEEGKWIWVRVMAVHCDRR